MRNLFHTVLGTSILLLSLSSQAANPGCNHELHEVELRDGSRTTGILCWKDQYFVVGYRIAPNLITRIAEPHLRVGNFAGDRFETRQTYRLSHAFDDLWCPRLGFKYSVGKIEGHRLFSLKVVRPTRLSREGSLELQVHKPKENTYIDSLHCADVYKDLITLRRRQLHEQRGTPFMELLRIPVDPIHLHRQK